MSKWQLASHQKEALFMMDSNPHLGIFFGMGCGKTMVALAWIYHAIEDGRIMRALIICPASLVGNWSDSIDKMDKFEGFTEEGIERVRKAVRITSFQKTYQSVKTSVKKRDGTTVQKKSFALRPEIDREWGAVIIDEAHNIGGHSSVQTRACLTIAKLARYRYIMTATPVHGGGGKEDFSKLYGEMKFLEPEIWPNWQSFCGRYVTSFDQWYHPRAYQVDSCRALMKNHAIVCRLEDCFDMPEKIETEIACPLEESKIYKALKECNAIEYGVDIDNAGGQCVKMLQVCSGSLKKDDGTTSVLRTSKDDALKDIVEGTDDKIVIFCEYRASIDRCAEICRKAGRRTVIADGRSKGETWREFQYGDAEVLICQYRVGGAGLDLFASAHMVFWEPCRSALLLSQATGRIYRKGQTRSCTYSYLYTPRTIEAKALECVRSGMDVTDEMLQKWAQGES